MFYKKIFRIENQIAYILFSILPVTAIIGSGVLNLSVLLIDLYFIFVIVKKKQVEYLINQVFFLLILIWFLLMLNSIIVANTLESFIRTFGFIRFVIFVFSLKYFFELNSEFFKKYVLGFWVLIFMIVTLDIYLEFFRGYNLLGFKSDYNGRIASFTQDELKIGNYYFGFILLALSFIYINLNKYNNLYFYFFSLLFLVTSFIIGERSNFFKVLIIISAFLFLVNNQSYIKKIITILIFIFVSSFIASNNNFFKSRFIIEIFDPIKEKGINKFIKETKHGLHFEIAQNIFNENKLFGIGIKNFRHESKKAKYNSQRTLEKGITTHPHQIHYEFLSETGLVGYLIFLSFFIISIFIGLKKFFKQKNNILILSSSLFLIATFLPILPSGSFFTSYTATIFWINYSFLLIRYK